MPLRCSNCGHLNAEDGKFCNSCGHRLSPPTRGLCPECGELNLPSNIFCDKCGARLAPARAAREEKGEESSVRGLSLPSREPSEEPIPNWLEQIRSGLGPTEADTASLDEPGPDSPGDEPPDWLADAPWDDDEPTLVPSDADIEPGEVPDWIQQLRPPELDREERLSGAAEIEPEPDVSPEIKGDEAGPSEKAGALGLEPEDMEAFDTAELPDWLRDIARQDEVSEEIEAEPAEAVRQPADADALDTDDLPAWLQDISRADETPAEERSEEAGAAPEPQEVDAFDTGELPAWLRDVAGEEVEPEEAEVAPEPREVDAFDTGDLPEWLRVIVDRDEVPQKTEPAEAAPTPEPAAEEAIEPDHLPQWPKTVETQLEASDEKAAPEPEPREVDAFDTGDLPGWLRDIVGGEAESEEPEPEEAEAAPQAAPEPRDVKATDTGDLPEWLREDEAADEKEPGPALESLADETPEEVEIPQWLREVRPRVVMGQEGDEEAAEPSEAASLEQAGLPDWLPEIQPTEEALEADVPEESLDASKELDEATIPELEAEGALVPESVSDQAEGDLTLEQAQPDLAELPDWLREYSLGGEEFDAPGLAPATPLIPDEQAGEKELTAREPPAEEHRLPSESERSVLAEWLGEMAQPVEDPAARSVAEGGTGPLAPAELPDWLAAVTTPAEHQLPDWLTTDVVTEAELDQGEGELRPLPSATLPSWLTDEDVGLSLTQEEAAQLLEPSEAGRGAGALPDWVRTGRAVAGKPGTGTSGERAAFLADLEAIDLAAISSAGAETETDEIAALGLAQAEIPDWLEALRPQQARDGRTRAPVEELEPIERGGILDGIRGALGVRSEVLIAPVRKARRKFEPTEQQLAHAQIMEQIVHAGPAPVPELVKRRRPQVWLEQTIIPILLLAAILLPAWNGNPLLGLIGAEARSEQAIATFNTLEDALGSGSATVVVAFDYTPAESAELNSVSTAFLRHMMNHGAKIVTLSTEPTGAEIAQDVLARSAGDLNYGEDYLNLGYLPGGATGLQLLANDPWSLFSGADYPRRFRAAKGAPASAGLEDSLADVDVLLILTASRDDLVAWVEQVGRLDEMQEVTLVAGTSASLAPWVQPYLSSQVVDGAVSGVPEAAQYEQQLDQEQGAELTDSATVVRDGQLMGLGVSVVVIALGLLWGVGHWLVLGRQRDG